MESRMRPPAATMLKYISAPTIPRSEFVREMCSARGAPPPARAHPDTLATTHNQALRKCDCRMNACNAPARTPPRHKNRQRIFYAPSSNIRDVCHKKRNPKSDGARPKLWKGIVGYFSDDPTLQQSGANTHACPDQDLRATNTDSFSDQREDDDERNS